MKGEGHICGRCGGASKWPNLCGPCAMADFEDHDDGDCWQCAGEGYTYDCFEEWACVDPEGGCDLCMRRCDVCGPSTSHLLEGADNAEG